MDGSLPAQRAANLAIQIASLLNLSIRGLYVVDQRLIMKRNTVYQAELDSRRDLTKRTDVIDQLKVKGESYLKWLEKQCRSANVSMTGDLFWGRVPDVLCKEASDASMLALGKCGNRHIDKHMLGSNFRIIINRVRLPILVGGDEARTLKQILFIEKSRRDISKTLALVARLQRSIHGGVIGLDIQKNNIAMQAGLSEIMAEFHKSGITDYRLVGHSGWSVAEIVAAACAYSADLIVIRRDRYPAMIKWLTGSTLGGFISAMPLPMLLIQEYVEIRNIGFEPKREKYGIHS